MSCHVLPRNHTQRIKAKSAKAKASRSRVPSRPQETTPRDRRDKSDQKRPPAHLQLILEKQHEYKRVLASLTQIYKQGSCNRLKIRL